MPQKMKSNARLTVSGMMVLAMLFSSSLFGLVLHSEDQVPEGQRPSDNIIGLYRSSRGLIAIAPNYLLTAGHWSINENEPIVIAGREYVISRHVRHPLYSPGNRYDIALIQIQKEDGSPGDLDEYVNLYAFDDEKGKEFIISGMGNARDSDLWEGGELIGYLLRVSRGVLRWGSNTIDSANDTLYSDFDAPLPLPDYEAAAADFDSGGGWFIKEGAEWKLAGVTILGTRPLEIRFGAKASAVRICDLSDWIYQTIKDLNGGDWIFEPIAASADTQWKTEPLPSSSDWSDSNNWTNGIPDGNEVIWINWPAIDPSPYVEILSGITASAQHLYIGTDLSGKVVQDSGSILSLNGYLYLGTRTTSTGSYQLDGGVLSSEGENIGYYGMGSFIQNGGANNVAGRLVMGYGPTGNGTYILNGATSSVIAHDLYIGRRGSGEFIQNEGAVTIDQRLSIREGDRYRLGGGRLNFNGLNLNLEGNIDFAPAEGQTVGGTLSIGHIVDMASLETKLLNKDKGTLEIQPNSLLIIPAGYNPSAVFAGYDNAGLLLEAGGTVNVAAGYGFSGIGDIPGHIDCSDDITASEGGEINLTGGLKINGPYNVDFRTGDLEVNDTLSGMEGGSLSVEEMRIGSNHSGQFVQNGGTVNICYGLSLGNDFQSGTYTVNNDASLFGLYLTLVGNSTFTQNGGTATFMYPSYVGYVTATSSTERSTFNLNGGSLSFYTLEIGDFNPGTFIQRGGQNTIQVLLDIGRAEGEYQFFDGILDVRIICIDGGIFKWCGGTILSTQQIINNGRFVVDGGETDRTFDLSCVSNIEEVDPNTNDTNGWYAINKGLLKLPAIPVLADATYNWGEAFGITEIDLVNSVQLEFTEVSSGGDLEVSLLATDHSESQLPWGWKCIGVWKMTPPENFAFSSANLTFRYDHAAADALGVTENKLLVLRRDGAQWRADMIPDQSDLANKRISLNGVAGLSAYYAIAEGLPGDANCDGMVDVGDLGILSGNYGTASGATWSMGDFNGDGAVDVGDLGILSGNYGAGPSQSVGAGGEESLRVVPTLEEMMALMTMMTESEAVTDMAGEKSPAPTAMSQP